MATMKDVADRANVSIATVSFVVNNTKPVSSETRARIVRAMEDLSYQRNVVARALASNKTRIIALLYPALDHGAGPTSMKFVTRAASVARTRGYDLVLWPIDNDASQMNHLIAGGLVDGVLLMEVELDDPRVDLLLHSRIPFELIGRTRDETLPAVDIDFEATVEDALVYLTDLGHRDVALVMEATTKSSLSDLGSVVRTEHFYREGMESRGLSPRVFRCLASPDGGRQAAADLLTAAPETTAIVVMNENAAFGVVSGIKLAGLNVPADVSVISISTSSEMGALSDPALTTLNAPAFELGQLGVSALIDQLEGKPRERNQVLLPCELVTGASAGPARLPA